MTPGLRRWLTWGTVIVGALLLGRGLVTFLATRWWAAGISTAARDTVTHWALLGLALDLGAILLASAWFAAQALLVARAIGSVQVERRIGNLTVREAIPTRYLLLGALAVGVLLGIVTGVGARDWRAPLALAWEGVHVGIADPLLGKDLGILVARYPVWHLAQRYLTLLCLLGLVLTALLYLGIGAVRRVKGRWDLHHDARRHLGGLLAVLALAIAWGYLLAPSRLATSPAPPIGDATARILAANAAAGAALAVMVMSLAWAHRGRNSLLIAGWIVFAAAALGERLVIPALLAEGRPPAPSDAVTRAMSAIAWGIRRDTIAGADEDPAAAWALWDEESLARWVRAEGATPVGAFQGTLDDTPVWQVASIPAGEASGLEVRTLAVGRLDPRGRPVVVGGESIRVAAPVVLPGREGWARRREGGVAAGGTLRRIALAWALQEPGLIRLDPSARIDWAVDPGTRLSRLIPPLDWTLTGMVTTGDRLQWVLSGLATVDRAPLAVPTAWRGRQAAGVVPALIGVADAADGSIRIFVDPGADALGRAWGRMFGAIVEPDSALPAELRAALPYPREWLEGQLTELERPHWAMGRRPGQHDEDGPPRAAAPAWEGGRPARQTMLEEPARADPKVLVSAVRRDGIPTLMVRAVGPGGRLGARALERLWHQGGSLSRLRDSTRAQGDTLLAGPLRWRLAGGRLLAVQPWFSAGRTGDPALVWIATADGLRPGGSRLPEELWPVGDSTGVPLPPVGGRAALRLEALAGWMRRADSALARGDLTAFGRAWEAMRNLVEAEVPE